MASPIHQPALAGLLNSYALINIKVAAYILYPALEKRQVGQLLHKIAPFVFSNFNPEDEDQKALIKFLWELIQHAPLDSIEAFEEFLTEKIDSCFIRRTYIEYTDSMFYLGQILAQTPNLNQAIYYHKTYISLYRDNSYYTYPWEDNFWQKPKKRFRNCVELSEAYAALAKIYEKKGRHNFVVYYYKKAHKANKTKYPHAFYLDYAAYLEGQNLVERSSEQEFRYWYLYKKMLLNYYNPYNAEFVFKHRMLRVFAVTELIEKFKQLGIKYQQQRRQKIANWYFEQVFLTTLADIHFRVTHYVNPPYTEYGYPGESDYELIFKAQPIVISGAQRLIDCLTELYELGCTTLCKRLSWVLLDEYNYIKHRNYKQCGSVLLYWSWYDELTDFAKELLLKIYTNLLLACKRNKDWWQMRELCKQLASFAPEASVLERSQQLIKTKL